MSQIVFRILLFMGGLLALGTCTVFALTKAPSLAFVSFFVGAVFLVNAVDGVSS
jgi:hypothetical protein